ncbi:MAG: tRNA (adenosine(37)-N6)-threonylcarbamoyltransferase complex ATPase subunit type 1 TsaE [Verrucomicrobiota bacterium]|nr:tRNA (adenosine(37)-N6)-threonylcarbamoyltransferase complex ATPase subunit type 1 TsaE [Verrucomicrobiota bacterium]
MDLTTFNSNSAAETLNAGNAFASRLRQGDVVALNGPMGAGKTHFAKGIASFFSVNPDSVSSPTFTLIHEYPCSIGTIYHMDLYRIETIGEAMNIGFEDYLHPDGITLIEWSERVHAIVPETIYSVSFKMESESQRIISVTQGKVPYA